MIHRDVIWRMQLCTPHIKKYYTSLFMHCSGWLTRDHSFPQHPKPSAILEMEKCDKVQSDKEEEEPSTFICLEWMKGKKKGDPDLIPYLFCVLLDEIIPYHSNHST